MVQRTFRYKKHYTDFESRVDSMLVAPDTIDDVRDDVLTPEQFAAATYQFIDTQIYNWELAKLSGERAKKFAEVVTRQALMSEQITSQYTWGELRNNFLPDLYTELRPQALPRSETTSNSPAGSSPSE